ncbi:MAG: GNAT family N-acetyltransferase, partial [Gaiella sp.]
RIYLYDSERGGGVGGLLMDALHERIGHDAEYMLLVVEGNDRAVRFYERQGLSVAELVDGLAYYAERMGVHYPSGTRPFRFVLMRRPARAVRAPVRAP